MADDEAEMFEKLYRDHVDGVLAYALARTNESSAVEAVQSTFLVAWRRLGEMPESAPRAWLIGVARKVLADQRRATGRREALGLRIYAMRANEHLGRDPADEVAERDSALRALERLSPHDRELLRLIAWDGLSTDDAAKVLGCSKTSMKVRLHRARRRFESLANAGRASEELADGATVVRPLPTDHPFLAKESI